MVLYYVEFSIVIWIGACFTQNPDSAFPDARAVNSISTNAPPIIDAGLWVLVTIRMVFLLFSLEDTVSSFSKSHRTVFLFASAHFKWSLAQQGQNLFWIIFTCGFFFPWWRFNLYMFVALAQLSSPMEISEGIPDCMQEFPWQKIILVFNILQIFFNFFKFSESVDDIMHCGLWNIPSYKRNLSVFYRSFFSD